jgi:hypothetical protein
VCRFHVATGEKLHVDKHFSGAIVQSVTNLAGINLRKCGSLSYWFDNLGFTTEGKLVVVFIIPSSWGSQLGAFYTPSLGNNWKLALGSGRGAAVHCTRSGNNFLSLPWALIAAGLLPTSATPYKAHTQIKISLTSIFLQQIMP